jgi:hypothetical protein
MTFTPERRVVDCVRVHVSAPRKSDMREVDDDYTTLPCFAWCE